RRTRSGAITRAFAVSSIASHDAPTASASTSFESIRCRYSRASGPCTRTNARRRLTMRLVVTLAMATSLGFHDSLPVEGRAEARRAWPRSRALAARAIPHGEVAGVARRVRAANRPRDVGVPHLRRGRKRARTQL